jgi:hypothetical protein
LFYGFTEWESLNIDLLEDDSHNEDEKYWFVDDIHNTALKDNAHNYYLFMSSKLFHSSGVLNLPKARQYLRQHKDLQNLIMVLMVGE